MKNVFEDKVDFKVTKKHFPKVNNESLLEFSFEKDPNLFLRKNSILIFGAVEIPKNYVMENGWVSKLFKQLKDEIAKFLGELEDIQLG